LRTRAVAAAFGRELGLPAEELTVVFHTALVRAIGCTSHAPENADDFDDDHKIAALRHYVDTAKHIAAWNGEDTTRRDS
jgi:hypothetical protein